MLSYTMLCYTILYYNILYYTILYSSLLSDQESDRAERIQGLRMMLADAAFRNDECSKALDYLNGLFTADGAYKQAQVHISSLNFLYVQASIAYKSIGKSLFKSYILQQELHVASVA